MEFTEEEKEFIAPKRFPSVMRDISVLASRDTRIGEILEEIEDASPKFLENVDLIDEYVDERFAGKQSITFRIVFQADDRTLTDTEVNAAMEKISVALKKRFGAEIR